MTSRTHVRQRIEQLDERAHYELERLTLPTPSWEVIRDLRVLVRELEALLIAGSAPLLTWYPIDTAPRDRPVLVFMRDTARCRAWQYEDGDPSKLVALAAWTNHNGGGWVSYHPGTPTHWMRLPDPPSVLIEDGIADVVRKLTEAEANVSALQAAIQVLCKSGRDDLMRADKAERQLAQERARSSHNLGPEAPK